MLHELPPQTRDQTSYGAILFIGEEIHERLEEFIGTNHAKNFLFYLQRKANEKCFAEQNLTMEDVHGEEILAEKTTHKFGKECIQIPTQTVNNPLN